MFNHLRPFPHRVNLFPNLLETPIFVLAIYSNTHLRPLIAHHDMKRELENMDGIALRRVK